MQKSHSLIMYCVCICIQIENKEGRSPSEEDIREKIWSWAYRKENIIPILISANICRVLVTVNDSNIKTIVYLEYGLVSFIS